MVGDVSTTALEFLMSSPDILISDIIKYNPEGIEIICLLLSLELNNINIKKENFKTSLGN